MFLMTRTGMDDEEKYELNMLNGLDRMNERSRYTTKQGIWYLLYFYGDLL